MPKRAKSKGKSKKQKTNQSDAAKAMRIAAKEIKKGRSKRTALKDAWRQIK